MVHAGGTERPRRAQAPGPDLLHPRADLLVVAAPAIQVHGGIGFTWEHDLHLYLKRGKANAHAFGDPRWHYDRVADLLGL
jgi:hypothetical protein